MFWVYLILYEAAASGVIFGLLVAADRHTELERPMAYVVCGMLWPVAALPAAAYIAAACYINREVSDNEGT